MTLSNFKTKKELVNDHHNLITENQLDWIVRRRNVNGLGETGALVKVSNKLYFDVEKFAEWFGNQAA